MNGWVLPLEQEPIQRLMEVLRRQGGIPLSYGFVNALMQVLLENSASHLIQTRTDGCDLNQHLLVISFFFPEALKTLRMTSETRQAMGDVLTCGELLCFHRKASFVASQAGAWLLLVKINSWYSILDLTHWVKRQCWALRLPSRRPCSQDVTLLFLCEKGTWRSSSSQRQRLSLGVIFPAAPSQT
jgi:hypothetical protein